MSEGRPPADEPPRGREPDPAPGTPARPRAFHWTQPEVAWPLALFMGFVLALGPATLRLPLVGPVLAALAMAGMHQALLRRGKAGAAAFAVGAWTLGLTLGVAAAFLDGEGLPGARALSPLEPLPLVDGLYGVAGVGIERPVLDPVGRIALAGLVAAWIWVTARSLAGFPALAGLALICGEAGAGAGRAARALIGAGEGEFPAVLLGVGPFLLLELAGLACILGGRAGAAPWIHRDLVARLGRVSLAGAVLVLAGGAARVLAGARWADLLQDLLR